MTAAPSHDVRLRDRALAKINLSLEITGKRDDGYHTLESLVVFAGVGDRLWLEAGGAQSAGLRLSVNGPFADRLDQTAADNLVLRAVHGLAGIAGEDAMGLSLVLEKNLPVASGIGGGSADAAAALRLLCRHWNLDPASADLLVLALGLGADVPVCLQSRAALVGGIGEIIAPPPALPPAWLVLVNPGIAVSTAEVFARRDGAYGLPGPWPERFQSVDDLAAALEDHPNDLEPPARGLVPEIGLTLEMLEGCEGCRFARMSGSGATCFGLFATEESARQAAETVAAARPDWWCVAAPMIIETG